MDKNELYHHGIKGQKWGVRRYQNKDGTLTRAGQKRYDKELNRLKKEKQILVNKERTAKKMDKLDTLRNEVETKKRAIGEEDRVSKSIPKDRKKPAESKPKSISDMSDEELQSAINRMRLEQQFRDLSPKKVSKGKEFINWMVNKVGTPAAENLGKQVVNSIGAKGINRVLKDLDFEEEYKVYTNNKRKDK